jgi:hypothetical protein
VALKQVVWGAQVVQAQGVQTLVVLAAWVMDRVGSLERRRLEQVA